MPISISDIPALKLTVLNKLVTKFMAPPNLILQKMFNQVNYESDDINFMVRHDGQNINVDGATWYDIQSYLYETLSKRS